MANIEVITPKTYSSYQLNTLCTVKFKINGTISCMSEKLTPRVSYKNSSGGFSHIIIQNLRCNSNGVYDDIDESMRKTLLKLAHRLRLKVVEVHGY